MNTRWRKQIKILKPVIKRDMEESSYAEWVEAVCGPHSTSDYVGVEGCIAGGKDAYTELGDIYQKLESIIPKERLSSIGEQRLFADFADLIGELHLGDE